MPNSIFKKQLSPIKPGDPIDYKDVELLKKFITEIADWSCSGGISEIVTLPKNGLFIPIPMREIAAKQII